MKLLKGIKSRRFRSRFIEMLWTILAWVFAIDLFFIVRFAFNPGATNPLNPGVAIDTFSLFLNFTRSAIILGIANSLLDLVFDRRVFRAMSYGRLILIKSGSYVLLFIFVILFVNIISSISYYGYLDLDLWFKNISGQLLLVFLVILPYILLVSFLINLTKQIDLKFGPGNLKNLLLGRFHHPRQDHRIFMFLDMKSSTTIAEKLGHIQISRLIQDCFTDLSIVRDYKAEIYQYVGDEAVLSWSLENGLENSNCIKAYFAFQNLLERRGENYKKKYGLIPFFKAGLNVGDVTLAEVGQIKREIAFHGDTLNTAARIEGMCNEYNKNLLLSQSLKDMLKDQEDFQIDEVGEFLLRGKTKASKIYSIEKIK